MRRHIWEVRNLMKPDEVHAAFQTGKQTDNPIRMTLVIIETGKHRIFETYTPLACEVILTDKRNHIFQRISLLDRHQFATFIREGIMHTDCKMTPGFIQIALEIGQNTYG